MRVIKRTIEKNEECDYPNAYGHPTDGLVKGIEYFDIKQNSQPPFDERYQTVEPTLVFTDEFSKDYPHLKIAVKGYNVVDLPVDLILTKLNEAFGYFLDREYPLYERQKHSDEIEYDAPTKERIDYIKSVKRWELKVRKERKQREFDLLNNGILPSFEFENKPLN